MRPFLFAGVKDSELEVSCSPVLGLLPTCCDVMVFIFIELVFIFVLFKGYLEVSVSSATLRLSSGPLVLPLEFCFAEESSTLENDAGILKTRQPAYCVSYLISSLLVLQVLLYAMPIY